MAINWTGANTLYFKEVRRFIKVYNQTLFAPIVTSLLFLAVFSLAIGDRVKLIGEVSFQEFMAAGLIIMALMQNAFANTSSSFIMGKVLGTIVDLLMPPLSAAEVIGAMTLAAITRGIMVGLLVGFAVYLFIPFEVYHWGYLIFYAFFSAMLLALLGLFGGIFAETFDQMSAVTSYIITPLTFLSGTFYSVHALPDFWFKVSQMNPFFYMIDGFRYGLVGHHDSSLQTGMLVMVAVNLFLFVAVYVMFSKGYRIKN